MPNNIKSNVDINIKTNAEEQKRKLDEIASLLKTISETSIGGLNKSSTKAITDTIEQFNKLTDTFAKSGELKTNLDFILNNFKTMANELQNNNNNANDVVINIKNIVKAANELYNINYRDSLLNNSIQNISEGFNKLNTSIVSNKDAFKELDEALREMQLEANNKRLQEVVEHTKKVKEETLAWKQTEKEMQEVLDSIQLNEFKDKLEKAAEAHRKLREEREKSIQENIAWKQSVKEMQEALDKMQLEEFSNKLKEGTEKQRKANEERKKAIELTRKQDSEFREFVKDFEKYVEQQNKDNFKNKLQAAAERQRKLREEREKERTSNLPSKFQEMLNKSNEKFTSENTSVNWEKQWDDALNNIQGKYNDVSEYFKDRNNSMVESAKNSAKEIEDALGNVLAKIVSENKEKSQSLQDFFSDNARFFGGNFEDYGDYKIFANDEALKNMKAEEDALAESEKQLVESQKQSEEQLLKNIGVLKEFASTGKLSEGTLSSLAASFGATAPQIAVVTLAITAAVAAFKIYNKLLDETLELVKNITKSIGTGVLTGFKKLGDIGEYSLNTIGNGIEFAVDSIENLIDIVDDALNKLQELADVGIDIQDAYYNMFTLIGTDASRDISNFVNEMSKLYGLDSAGIVSNMKDIVAAAGSMGLSVNDMSDAIKNMTVYAQNLSVLAGSFEKAQLDIGNAISKGYIGKASVLYPLMTKNEIKQLKELSSETERYNYLMSISSRVKGRYVDYLDTEAGKIAVLKSQYKGLNDNIGTLALGLYSKLAPILTNILKLLNGVLEAFIKIFNINIKDYSGLEGVTAGIAESMQDVADSTKDANKQLASFDDVIQLSKNNDDTLGANINKSDIDLWSDLLDMEDAAKTKLDEIIEDLQKLLEQGKYYEAGQLLAKSLNEYLNGIDWDTIIKKAGEAGKSIASFLNGLIDFRDLWVTFGRTLGSGANTVLSFLNGFAKELHWENLGKDIVASWNEFWDTLDKDLAAETLYNWFMGIFTLVKEFIQGGGIKKAVEGIMDIIVGFFDRFDQFDAIDLADTVVALVDQIIDSLGVVVEKLKDSDFQLDFNTFIMNLVHKINENASDWGNEIGGALAFVFELASGALGAFLQGGGFSGVGDLIIGTIQGFFENLTEKDLTEAADNLVGLLGNIIDTASETVHELVTNEDFRKKISTFIKELIQKLSENASDWGESINQLVTDILDFLSDSLSDAENSGLRSAIYDFINALNVPEIIKEWFTLKIRTWIDTQLPIYLGSLTSLVDKAIQGLLDFSIIGIIKLIGKVGEGVATIKEKFGSIPNFIKEVFKGLGTWWNDFIDGMKQKLKDLLDFGGMKESFTKGWGNILGGSKNTSTYTYSILEESSSIGSIKIPKLAKGGIVNQATLAMIGEAGSEAVVPLQNNTDWMNEFANKLASKLNSSNGTKNSQQIVINMADITKPVYTRSEMLEMGEHYAEALRLYGINVSVVM